MILEWKEKCNLSRVHRDFSYICNMYILENIFKNLNQRERELSGKLWSCFRNIKGILEI